ncbi:MAG: fimbrillin family protein [Bacteroidales bacterium]|nr:fimbrillin family protein [Bacteroidales bacterium]
MKKYLVPLLFAAALLVSCEKQQESTQPVPKGDAIEFSMSSTAVNTKTSYGAISGSTQPINWENGDKFTVYCSEAFLVDSDDKKANYKVTTSSSGNSVSPDDQNKQLMWGGDGDHTFYAAYPAGHLDGNTFTGEIPTTQNLTGTNGVYAPLLSDYGYMVAATTVAKTNNAVNLVFKPIFSTIEFTVGPGPSTAVDVKGFRLESTTSTLAGGFDATINVGSDPTFSNFSTSAKAISVTFGDTVHIEKNGTITFTVIAVPNEMTNLTAYFSVDNKELAIPLKNKDTGAFFTLGAGRKSRINASGALGPEAVQAGFTVDITAQGVDEYSISGQ